MWVTCPINDDAFKCMCVGDHICFHGYIDQLLLSLQYHVQPLVSFLSFALEQLQPLN